MNKENCQIEGCKQRAKYALYYIKPITGEKKWLHVCREHEAEIGQENLCRAGGYWKGC